MKRGRVKDTDGVGAFLRWCEATGTPAELTKPAIQAFVAYLLEKGAEATTARSGQLGVRRISAWLAQEGEIDDDPLIGINAPKLDAKVTSALTDDELKRLTKACQGKSLRDRRDEAIIRLMAETGMRAGEIIGMQTSDVDLQRGLATVRRGKGGKGRVAPFSPQTATAIDRYMRARRPLHRGQRVGADRRRGARARAR